ncbi:hypothetical protein [Blastococcus sp. SYSU D00820]
MSAARRSPHRRPHGRRALLVTGLVAAAVALPGVASAEEGGSAPALPPELQSVVEDVQQGVGDLAGGVPGGVPATGDTGEGAPAPTAPAVPELPGFDPSMLEPLGLSADCVGQFQATVEAFLADLQTLLTEGAAEFQGLVTDLVTKLTTDPGSLLDPALLDPGAIPGADELEALVTNLVANLEDLAAACVPVPEAPGTTPPPAPPAAHTPEPPATHPQPVAAPVAQQPVQYLGYAPTGGEPADDGPGALPLAALGGAALLAGATAVTRMRTRVARDEG